MVAWYQPATEAIGKERMTDTSKLVELANSFLTNLRARNLEGLARIMTPDSVWSLPGQALISGKAMGIAAVVARADLIASYGIGTMGIYCA